jgi:hypothetical protein
VNRVGASLLLLFVLACGRTKATVDRDPTPAKSATATASAAQLPLKIVPARIFTNVAPEPFELLADGTVVHKGERIAKVIGASIEDRDGRPILSIDAKGAFGPGGRWSFDETDAIVSADSRFFVRDDGSVEVSDKGKTQHLTGGRIEGFVPEARRAVTLVVFVLVAVQASKRPHR